MVWELTGQEWPKLSEEFGPAQILSKIHAPASQEGSGSAWGTTRELHSSGFALQLISKHNPLIQGSSWTDIAVSDQQSHQGPPLSHPCKPPHKASPTHGVLLSGGQHDMGFNPLCAPGVPIPLHDLQSTNSQAGPWQIIPSSPGWTSQGTTGECHHSFQTSSLAAGR